MRELLESLRRCACRDGACAQCLGNFDRLDAKLAAMEEAAERHDATSRSRATARNARREGSASDNHRDAVLHRGAANALRALLDGKRSFA